MGCAGDGGVRAGVFLPGYGAGLTGRTLILIGLVIAGAGLLMTLGLPIGRLPGDFTIRRGNFSFYFPLATSIVVSILLTLIMMFLGGR
ncbi:MAG TPA: DUF2905 domain-containing protein [Vicinamibacterales bacterium]|nr:DUF2905 domain-containing protein [Vicinamibacterales bacterium]